jgi:hypothetical protein
MEVHVRNGISWITDDIIRQEHEPIFVEKTMIFVDAMTSKAVGDFLFCRNQPTEIF